NAHLTTNIRSAERGRLHDLLFSPSVPRWDPYVYELDFPRTSAVETVNRVKTLLSFGFVEGACVLTGTAASGKTTALKRMAYDLAKSTHYVVWFRPWFYQDSQSALNDLFSALAKG